jgi:4'-phosphopantetheinyl transferase
VACVRDFESDQVDEVLLHPAEHTADPIARARIWARKEALLKATGDGLRIDPRTIRVTGSDEPPGLVGSERPLTTLQPRLYDVEVDEAHVACVCALGRAPKRLSVREAALAAPVC